MGWIPPTTTFYYGAVAISFDATRYGINLSTELDYLVSVCLNATAPPQILLQGRWLERAGFNAGDKITVDCQQGRFVITKDESEADT